jgi:hypothetical protein
MEAISMNADKIVNRLLEDDLDWAADKADPDEAAVQEPQFIVADAAGSHFPLTGEEVAYLEPNNWIYKPHERDFYSYTLHPLTNFDELRVVLKRFKDARLVESDDLDWTPDPADDAAAKDYANQTIDQNIARGTVDKDVCTSGKYHYFYHRTLKTAKKEPLRARTNGACKVWKRQPEKFMLPMKYGLYDYFYITQDNAHEWSTVPNPTA